MQGGKDVGPKIQRKPARYLDKADNDEIIKAVFGLRIWCGKKERKKNGKSLRGSNRPERLGPLTFPCSFPFSPTKSLIQIQPKSKVFSIGNARMNNNETTVDRDITTSSKHTDAKIKLPRQQSMRKKSKALLQTSKKCVHIKS